MKRALGKMQYRGQPVRGTRVCKICGERFAMTRPNRRTCGKAECRRRRTYLVHRKWADEHQPRDTGPKAFCVAFDHLYPLAKANLNWRTLPFPMRQLGPKFVKLVHSAIEIRLVTDQGTDQGTDYRRCGRIGGKISHWIRANG